MTNVFLLAFLFQLKVFFYNVEFVMQRNFISRNFIAQRIQCIYLVVQICIMLFVFGKKKVCKCIILICLSKCLLHKWVSCTV